jgi:hypothetical protein
MGLPASLLNNVHRRLMHYSLRWLCKNKADFEKKNDKEFLLEIIRDV